MAMRQRSGASAKCTRSDALYIMKRRLMISVVRMMSAAGAAEASSCAEATIEAPANTMSDISSATSGGMPLATIATPVITPNGTMPSSTGRVARAPAANAGWCSSLEIAARQLGVADHVPGQAHLLGVALAQRHLDRLDVAHREHGERAVGEHHQVRALEELLELELLGGGVRALLRKTERGLGAVHEGDGQSAAFFFRHGPSRCRRAHSKATSSAYCPSARACTSAGRRLPCPCTPRAPCRASPSTPSPALRTSPHPCWTRTSPCACSRGARRRACLRRPCAPWHACRAPWRRALRTPSDPCSGRRLPCGCRRGARRPAFLRRP